MKKVETAEAWEACDDPAEMMRCLRLRGPQRTRYVKHSWFARYKKDQAGRKVRLLLLACCQRLCDAADPACVELLQAAEGFTESAPPLLPRTGVLAPYSGAPGPAGVIASSMCQPVGLALAQLRLHLGRRARAAAGTGEPATAAERGAIRQEAQAQCALLRDVFGNPFRVVKLKPVWRTTDVLGLARAIDEDRAFDRLPLLADTLMDAGCDDDQILLHCRSGGPHVRGCWVVDLVLGKE